MRNIKIITTVLVMLVLTLLVAACQAPAEEPEKEEGPFKVCMVLAAAINDQSWGTAGYSGLQRAAEIEGVETAYVEQVPPTDWEETIRNFAAEDCDLVQVHGGEFSDAVLNVSKEFPDVMFSCVNCSEVTENLASISMNDEQLAYVVGALAAMKSESKVVGYIGGMEIPPTVRNAYGYEQGAMQYGAEEVLVTYTGSFEDAGLAKEAAISQAEAGADVIYYYVNLATPGVLEGCKEAACFVVGSIIDQYEAAPDIYLSSALQDVGALHLMAVEQALDGTLEGKHYLVGIESDAMALAPLHHVTDNTADSLEELKEGIISGEIEINRAELE